MRSYVREGSWWCEWCALEVEYRYIGQHPRFCSNVCKYRAKDEARRLEQEKLRRKK